MTFLEQFAHFQGIIGRGDLIAGLIHQDSFQQPEHVGLIVNDQYPLRHLVLLLRKVQVQGSKFKVTGRPVAAAIRLKPVVPRPAGGTPALRLF
jgi:hypothetical protein